ASWWYNSLFADYYWPHADTADERDVLQYVDLSTVAEIWLLSRRFFAFAGFLVYFGLLKYLKIFPSLGMLPRTFFRAMVDVGAFFLSFVICLLGFSVTFISVFGDSIEA